MRLLPVVLPFLFFTLLFLLLPAGSVCAQEAKTTCRTSSSTTTTSGKANTVTSPSLSDDWINSEMLMYKTMPSGINMEINESNKPSASPLPIIGVQQGFIGNLVCILPSFVSNLLGTVCPQNLSLAGDLSNGFVEKAKFLGQVAQPEGFENKPEEQDCYITDDPENNKAIQGNADVDELSTSLGTRAGVYTDNIPQLEGTRSADVKENLNLNGKVFTEDKRVPDINDKCKDFSQANYAPGISACE